MLLGLSAFTYSLVSEDEVVYTEHEVALNTNAITLVSPSIVYDSHYKKMIGYAMIFTDMGEYFSISSNSDDDTTCVEEIFNMISKDAEALKTFWLLYIEIPRQKFDAEAESFIEEIEYQRRPVIINTNHISAIIKDAEKEIQVIKLSDGAQFELLPDTDAIALMKMDGHNVQEHYSTSRNPF